MIRNGFDAKNYIEKVAGWLKGAVEKSGCKGVVVGLSGGIDSAVVAGICAKALPNPEQRLGIALPCQSNPTDAEHGKSVAEAFKMPFETVDLSATYQNLVAAIYDADMDGGISGERHGLARANTKSRLRMVTLYAYANKHSFMVVGTSNLPEMTVGYFTKFGDGGCDIELIAELTKDEVRACARELGVPEPVITKAPSAGLWDGQTDEAEMGMTYDQLDKYCLGFKDELPREVVEKIERMNRCSTHKRSLPPAPKLLT